MTLPASGAISFSCINTELGFSSTSQISLNDASVRTLFGQASGAVCMNTGHSKSNTSVPGTPTSVSDSSPTSSSVSVSFSAPACNGHLTIDTYQAISTPGCITASSSSSPISVTGLSPSTAYTFRVRAHNSKGYGCYSSASVSITTSAAAGSQSYICAGNYTWVAPAGVTSVSFVLVGAGFGGGLGYYNYSCPCGPLDQGGYGGGGGATGYTNSYSVTPGYSYAVTVGTPCISSNGGKSIFNGIYVYGACRMFRGGNGTTSHFEVGGPGGMGATNYGYLSGGGGGGGAGGYSGIGGAGGSQGCPGAVGLGGAGGGGGGTDANKIGKGGGGVGIYGQGSSGAAGSGSAGSVTGASAGGGGSGGGNGCGNNGGSYGAGGGGAAGPFNNTRGTGKQGAVRIVWPGSTRQFPSTCVGA